MTRPDLATRPAGAGSRRESPREERRRAAPAGPGRRRAAASPTPALGLWLLRALRLPARGAERVALAYVFGTGAASLALLILYGVGLHVPLLALAVVALAGVPALRTEGAGRAGCRRRRRPRRPGSMDRRAHARRRGAALPRRPRTRDLLGRLRVSPADREGLGRARHPRPAGRARRASCGPASTCLYGPALAAGQPDAAACVSAGFALALAALVRGRGATPRLARRRLARRVLRPARALHARERAFELRRPRSRRLRLPRAALRRSLEPQRRRPPDSGDGALPRLRGQREAASGSC